jgi:hypothetical protein
MEILAPHPWAVAHSPVTHARVVLLHPPPSPFLSLIPFFPAPPSRAVTPSVHLIQRSLAFITLLLLLLVSYAFNKPVYFLLLLLPLLLRRPGSEI